MEPIHYIKSKLRSQDDGLGLHIVFFDGVGSTGMRRIQVTQLTRDYTQSLHEVAIMQASLALN